MKGYYTFPQLQDWRLTIWRFIFLPRTKWFQVLLSNTNNSIQPYFQHYLILDLPRQKKERKRKQHPPQKKKKKTATHQKKKKKAAPPKQKQINK